MSPDDLPGVMPVFPLPGVVFFPHTSLPLHIFEPRYRQMVEDALETDGWLSVALLDPSSPPADDDRPAFHRVAGAGKIVQCKRLPDGRYDIAVEGRERVRLAEVDSDRPYRRVSVTSLPEDLDWLAEREGTQVVAQILNAGGRMGLFSPDSFPETLPLEPGSRAALLNRVASTILADPAERQALLVAGDYRERAHLLLKQIRIAVRLAEALSRGGAPDDVRRN